MNDKQVAIAIFLLLAAFPGLPVMIGVIGAILQ